MLAYLLWSLTFERRLIGSIMTYSRISLLSDLHFAPSLLRLIAAWYMYIYESKSYYIHSGVRQGSTYSWSVTVITDDSMILHTLKMFAIRSADDLR